MTQGSSSASDLKIGDYFMEPGWDKRFLYVLDLEPQNDGIHVYCNAGPDDENEPEHGVYEPSTSLIISDSPFLEVS